MGGGKWSSSARIIALPSRFHSCPLECGHACNLSCKISWCPRQFLGPGDTTLHQYTCPCFSFLFLPSIHLTAGHLSLLCLFSLNNYRLKLCFLLALLWESSPLGIRSFTYCSGAGFSLRLWSRRYWRTTLTWRLSSGLGRWSCYSASHPAPLSCNL